MLAQQIEQTRFPADKNLLDALLSDEDVSRKLEMTEALQSQNETRVGLLASAVRVDVNVLPQLASAVSRLVELGAVDGEIEAYVFQQPAINAFVTRGHDRTLVAISSATINTLNDREMDFIIGHELGHAVHGHLELAIGHLVETGQFAATSCMRMRAWQRAAEISADRAGLLCCGSIESAASALFKCISGLNLDGLTVSPEEMAGQWDHLCREVAAAGERDQWQLTHPFPPLRMKAMTVFWPAIRDRRTDLIPSADREAERMLAMMDPASDGDVFGDTLLADFFFWGGLYIALADGTLDQREVDRLQEVAPSGVVLRADIPTKESHSEQCLQRFREGVGGRRKKLSAVELHRIIYGLIDVAAADGHIDANEVKRLETLGGVLGIHPNACDLIIEKYKKEASQ